MLTDTKVKALRPQLRPYRVADTNGLCIEIRPTGLKVWRYRYRFEGKASLVTIAEYPQSGLATARTERDRLRAMVKAGKNPAREARVDRLLRTQMQAGTFGSIAVEWLEKREREGLSEASVKRERRLLEKDLALVYKMPIGEITAPLLLAELRKLERRGAVESAHRARSLAARIFRYAIATGRTQINPADALVGALQQLRTKHMASLTDPEQIGHLLRAMYSYKGLPATVAALKLAPMLFVRPGELRRARWADIDLGKGEWRFVASKTGTPHIVPLAHQAIAVLSGLKLVTDRSEYVFPSIRSIDRRMSENTINAALRYLGYDGETITGHGFRAMARTVLDEVLGFRSDYIEHQLAHAVRDPLGRAYNRTSHLVERKVMMQSWADYLDDLRSGNASEAATGMKNAA